ncbi:MAG: sulfatase-like hydrolase/transferase, partial [Saprospiraceae bacterium]|nr:sulfatase-like hydrolase/transferase [Saprospiraceae bacterium]
MKNNILSSLLLLTLFWGCKGEEHKTSIVSNAGDYVGAVLPFPSVPSASVTSETLAESKHIRRAEPDHLPKDAPNILIVLMDDVGFGTASTFGGEINTPTLTKVYNEGIAYNEFHTTAICSPTRASLLTGRNHTRVGNGTIAERAVDWDGFTGI